MTMYERVKPAGAGPVAGTYLEVKMLCLFYFFLESAKIFIMSGLQWYLRKDYISPLYFIFLLFQFKMLIDSCVNSSHSLLM